MLDEVRAAIELILALTMPLAMMVVIVHRVKSRMGIGVRAIQFLALGMLTPLVLILALEGILERSAVGALVGILVGYFFAGFGKDDQKTGIDDG
jgi:hypothetical protein